GNRSVPLTPSPGRGDPAPPVQKVLAHLGERGVKLNAIPIFPAARSGRPVPGGSDSEMAISGACPSCRTPFAVPDHLFGKKVRCARCQRSFIPGSIPQAQPRPSSKLRTAPPVAIPVGIPSPQQGKSSGIVGIVFGGVIVAAVFALIVVGGIALILKPG